MLICFAGLHLLFFSFLLTGLKIKNITFDTSKQNLFKQITK